MKDGFIKVCACTCDVRVADCQFNCNSIISAMHSANEQGAKILVTPELSLTGATCGDLFYQSALIQGVTDALSKIKDASVGSDMLIFVGAPLSVYGKLYNTCVCISNGKILGAVPKSSADRQFCAPTDEVFDITLCGQTVPFGSRILYSCDSLGDLTIACVIGDDLYSLESSAGATVLVHMCAEPTLASRLNVRHDTLCAESRRLSCGILSANAGVNESTTNFVCGGENFICENGDVLASTKPFENGTAVSELDISKIASAYQTRCLDGYRTVTFSLNTVKTQLTRNFNRLPLVPDNIEKMETVLSVQAHGLKRRIECAYAKSAVIGISGGLDSCLALLVAVRSMELLGRPNSDIVAVTMPCFGTTKRTRGNAEILCNLLGVTLRTVDIKRAVDLHFDDIGHDKSVQNAVYENSQARERTQILMDIANQVNGIVVGTGDMSELALGWATYNGDHMSMYGVNATVSKTAVRALVRHIADTSDTELARVLADIIDTPVSPELLPADNEKITQQTEDLVGPYELHDFYLYHLIYNRFTPHKVLRLAEYVFGGDYDSETLRHWLKTFIKRFFAQQFKRSCLPDGPKTDVLSLSPRGDWSMPSDAVATLWLSDLDN